MALYTCQSQFPNSSHIPSPPCPHICHTSACLLETNYHKITNLLAYFYSKVHTNVQAKSLLSHLTLCNSMEHSLPGSSVHRILQARPIQECTYLKDRALPTAFPKMSQGIKAKNGFPRVTGPLAVKCTQSKMHQEERALKPVACGSKWSILTPGLQRGAELEALRGSPLSLGSLLSVVISGAWSGILLA